MQSDLISKRALIKFIDKTVVPELLLHDNVSGAGVMAGLSKVLEETDVFPTIDAVPVVHGRWEYSIGSYSTPKCSCCGWHIPYSEDSVLDARNYCPNCGAKMDGGAEG